MKRIYHFIFSGEFFFALFLTAGYFKNGFTFIPEWLDLTLLFLGLSLVVSIKRSLRKSLVINGYLPALFLFAVLCVIFWISSKNSISLVYAPDKFLRFSLITSWAFIAPFLILKSNESKRKFFKGIVLIAIMMTIFTLFQFSTLVVSGSYNGKILVLNTDYLAIGRTIGLGLIILISSKWLGEKNEISKNKFLNFITIILMLISVMISGAKMPLISIFISILILIFFNIKIKYGGYITYHTGIKKFFALFMLLIIVFIPLGLSGFLSKIFDRFEILFQGGDESALSRLARFDVAINMFQNNPWIGKGFGSFPLYFSGIDLKDYPHNIFLELMAETGIVGLLPFIFLLCYALYNGIFVYKKKHNTFSKLQVTIISLFVFFFLNANTSGDITDNKILFTFMALLSISPWIKSNTLEKSINIKQEQLGTNKKFIA